LLSRQSFVALQHRNYRLIWIGLLVSFSGSMMQNAALLWHVSLLVTPERKGLALGLVGLVRVVPIVVFSMISGVVADAWDRRRLMLFTQIGATLVALALGAIAFRGVTVVWPIYVLAALASAVGAFDLPARNALVPSLVPREHLPNAISLNTIMFQTASVVGPSLGGVLIAASGVGWVYVANAISFGFVSSADPLDVTCGGAFSFVMRFELTFAGYGPYCASLNSNLLYWTISVPPLNTYSSSRLLFARRSSRRS